MADQPRQSRSLAEISHLFLSSIREQQKGSASRPQRKPPAPRRPSVDLTPEEFNQVSRVGEASAEPSVAVPAATVPAEEACGTPPVRAIIASHFGSTQLDQAKRYARSVAAGGTRVGLIAIDSCEFTLFTFDPHPGEEQIEVAPTECFDGRAMTDALNELGCDLDCWLLVVLNPKLTEGRSLLRSVAAWTLLCGAEGDDIVNAYRAIKGLADGQRPRLSLAILDARDAAHAEQIGRKLAGVCSQFLQWPAQIEPPVLGMTHVAEVPVMCCRPTHDKAQVANSVHWRVVGDLLAKAGPAIPPQLDPASSSPVDPQLQPTPASAIPAPAPAEEPVMNPTQPQSARPVMTLNTSPASALPEVIDLPADGSDGNILSAIMGHLAGRVIEAPLRPPMCPEARIAIDRERRLTLIAIASHGLGELRSIGLAWRWLMENRPLLSMALPQFALDPHQLPHLRLIVDHADLDAEVLAPIFQVNTVSIHSYRRVKWGQRTGLLLDAA